MRRTPPLLLLLGVLAAWPAHGQAPGMRLGAGTPPRLAVVEGTASFWRPGASDWTSARPNTPLGTGDAIFSQRDTSVEVQIGPSAYLRLGAATYLELSEVSADQLQLKLATGEASLDVRELPVKGIEIDTPHMALTVDRQGYYRLHVDKHSSTLIVRRGGGAMATPGNAPSSPVRSGEETVMTSDGVVHHFAAPDLDAWDRWSAARTDRLLDPLSARYVADGIYGVADLDHAGTWRRVDEYGPVWFPDAVPSGWVPFTGGEWIYDTAYGWSWVDDMPWGWAPFHHGRWVAVEGRWAWAPGPPDVVPAYAPATVGWLEGGPGVAWVPLGWGEPIFPWWGPPGALGNASWAGWGGPWFVNRQPIQQRIAIYASNLSYANAAEPGAVVTTRADRFGRGGREHVRATPGDVGLMRPGDRGPGVSPVAASLSPTTERAAKPPSSLTGQRVVATRMPPDAGARLREFGLKTPGTAVVQLVLPPPRTVLATGDRPPEAGAPPAEAQAEPAAVGDRERRPPPAPGFVEWLGGAEYAEATRRGPRDMFEASASDRGFDAAGEAFRTDLPGQPAMALRPSGGASGFVVAERDRQPIPMAPVKKTPAAPPPPPAAPPPPVSPPPPVLAALATTTTSLAASPTTLPAPITPATSTTIAAAPEPVAFRGCTALGDECGPCQPRGQMALCARQIGATNLVCARPETCFAQQCLWDRDCGSGTRCVQHWTTGQSACCEECTELGRLEEPRVAVLSSTTTSSTMVVPPPTYAPPPTTVVTSTTYVPPPTLGTSTTLISMAPVEFQACSGVGAACGPCASSGDLGACMRAVGKLSPVCAVPTSCIPLACLWDSDCGEGRRCVQNTLTMQTNCCDECMEAVGEHRPRYVVLSSTTTSSTSYTPVVTSTSRYVPPVTTTTTVVTPTATPPTWAAPAFQGCGSPGAECGPCPPSNQMSRCFRQVGKETALCAQPDTCVASWCVWDKDCGPGRRCVVNPATLQTNCCEQCLGLGRDDLFDVVTTTTLPPAPGTFQPCLAPGDMCGPCAPSGLMTTCHQEIGSARVLCPKPGACVEITCSRSSDCVPGQRCVFNANTARSNCCEECPDAAQAPPPPTLVPTSTTTSSTARQSFF